MTRREQQRAEMLVGIRDAARAELRAEGTRGLSLRNIARRAGLSPAGLYRYYEGRDGILTALLTHLLLELGSAMEQAVERGEDTADSVLGAFMAYRDWSVANPSEFNLCFGEPLPDYAAPPGGPTVDAFREMFKPLVMALATAHASGALAVPDVGNLSFPEEVTEAMLPGAAPGVIALAFETWARVHGITSLEVNGHLAYLGTDTRPIAADQMSRMVEQLFAPTGR